ncbi:HupE/UreJ family protein, partial [Caldimonas tepidiphila]|uniref:HupE/UreJ family protein n=1 Tax=Caldimonas tepidiphila TaxID=2315841 RepID=UPI00130082C4
MKPGRWRWLPHLLGIGALALLSPAAGAHKPSDAYVRLEVSGQRIEQRVDIALRDLDRELDLDADADSRLTWGEVRKRWSDIEGLAAAKLKVQAEGRHCEVAGTGPARLDEHTDGRYAVLSRTLECDGPVQAVSIDYRLFAQSDPTHRGIARLAPAQGGALLTAVLGPQTPAHRFEPGAAASGSAPQGFGAFLREGLHHIAIGLDHILFLVSLLLVAVWRRENGRWVPRQHWRPAAAEVLRLVTAFTVAHSLTLGLAAAGVLAPPSRPVEALIAASVLIAAVDNLVPVVPLPRWAMVFLFGLVHGFGFAGPLQDLGLERGALALPLLGFNLGVEL